MTNISGTTLKAINVAFDDFTKYVKRKSAQSGRAVLIPLVMESFQVTVKEERWQWVIGFSPSDETLRKSDSESKRRGVEPITPDALTLNVVVRKSDFKVIFTTSTLIYERRKARGSHVATSTATPAFVLPAAYCSLQ